MKLSSNKILYPLVIFFFTLFIYIFFAGRLKLFFPISIYNYFSYLAEAFLHGSLSFISYPPYLHDLTTFNGNIYMYWGPAPVILILPFVFFFGRGISDALYTAIISSFTPMVLYLLLHQLNKITLIKTSVYQRIILCTFFAFGTVYFYLSIFGTVWFTSQVISILYLLISLLAITKYSESKSLKTLVISSFFFGLAFSSRLTMFFYIPLLLVFLIMPYLEARSLKKCLNHILIFVFIIAVFFALSWLYNYLRFGSLFENGYSYHHFGAHFAESASKYGSLNLAYIPRNFYYMFANLPAISTNFPFFSFDTEGNSILFTSPLFLILIWLIKKKYWLDTKLKLFNLSSVVGSSLVIIFLLTFWGTGWVQFGYRYSLDTIPFWIFFLAQIITEVPAILTIVLLVISILINLLGILWFISL